MISRRDLFRTMLGAPPPPPQGIPRVDPRTCYAAQSNICEVCYECCPQRPRAVRHSRGSAAEILPDRCDNCGLCLELCPADAIHPAPSSRGGHGSSTRE
jgi:NAD-dependent dihydropyrimidine dehydrogenase PreA subunit